MFQRRGRRTPVELIPVPRSEPSEPSGAQPDVGEEVEVDPPAAGSYRLFGAENPSILVAGHSHALPLLWAIRDELGPAEQAVAVAYSTDILIVPIDAAYWDYVVENADGRTVVILWSGNYHLTDFLIAGEVPVRVWSGDARDPGAGAGVWVPREMLREHWAPAYRELDDLLARLTATAKAVVIVSTPPPKRDEIVRAALANEPFFAAQARELGIDPENVTLTAEADRLAMWQITQELLRERATAGGAQFLAIPAQATDSDGFLLAPYSYPDVTHANAEFGQLLWSELTVGRKTEVSA